MRRTLLIPLLLPVLGGAALLTGCTNTRSVRANHDLRLEREELRDRVASLEAEIAELQAKLDGLSSGAGLSAEQLSAVPAIARVEISRTSGFRRDGGVSVLVMARDGREMDVQAVGTLTVELRVAEEGGTRAIASKSVAPEALRRAYRSGLLGPAYEVRFDASEVGGSEVGGSEVGATRGVVVVASLADAITGATFEASRVIERAGTRVEAQAR